MKFPTKTEGSEAAAPAEVCAVSFRKVYGGGKTSVTACGGIDFAARRGAVTGILGLNGAGKSSLLKALCGVHYATSGRIAVYGETSAAAIRRMTGYVPETPELDESLTVKETLYMEASLHGLSAEEGRAELSRTVAALELEDVLAAKVRSLSKGYRQRTSLAKALAGRPKVLVLDEFSAGLDPAQIVRFRRLINSLAAERVVILSTHHIEEAEALCRQLYILRRGRVAARGTREEVIAASGKRNLEEAFLWLTKA